MTKYIPEKLAVKIAIILDIVATLFVEQVGYIFKMPFWHPLIFGSASAITIISFKWKDEIAKIIIFSIEKSKHGMKKFLLEIYYDLISNKYYVRTPIYIQKNNKKDKIEKPILIVER
ncbi:MAG: hypothetical protein QXY18_04120 [Nitrososphaerota archaeon]|nr:hypothetical protein [Candidatus Aenigmarchaeota archaeon]